MGQVIFHLDYNNIVLIGLPKYDINWMQRMQSFTTKIVLDEGKYSNFDRGSQILTLAACWVNDWIQGGMLDVQVW